MKIVLQSDPSHLQEVWQSVPTNKMLRARVVEIEPLRAELQEVIATGFQDDEFESCMAEMLDDASFDDDLLGHFELDEYDRYCSETNWGSIEEVELVLETESESEVAAALEVARALWADVEGWNKTMNEFLGDKVLALKNNNWLEENEERLQRGDLLDRTTLGHIRVYPDRSFEFVFYDDGIFLEHDIVLNGTLDEGWTDFGLQG